MNGARKWMAELLLRTPMPLRSLRNTPVLGSLIHRVSHRLLPADQKVWKRIEVGPAKGLWLELNPRTGQNDLRGDAEAEIKSIVAKRLRGGMVFYDLGANIGVFTLLAARLVGPNGKVFSFEPDAWVASRLRKNVARNGFENVCVIEAGVWSKSGAVNFLPADSAISADHAIGTFVAGENGAAGTPRECVALDDFIATAAPPDLIKCDVEGAEMEALAGGDKLLRTHRPWVICELHSEANEKTVRSYFRNIHYDVRSIDRNHILAVPQDGS